MNLLYKLPSSQEGKIHLSDGEKIYYTVPIDIDEKGNWTEDSFLVVTTFKVHVLREDRITSYDIKDLDSASRNPVSEAVFLP